MAENAPRLITCTSVSFWFSGNQIVVTGDPLDEDQLASIGVSDEHVGDIHNCDAMGCGQEHVLLRILIPAGSEVTNALD